MVTVEEVYSVLRTIDDPEMPISIVDLGIVEDVQITPAVGKGTGIRITLLPTFVGCPALPVLEETIRQRVLVLDGVGTVEVRFVFDPPWSVDRISEQGRRSLQAHGVTVPANRAGQPTEPALVQVGIACPFCGETASRLDSPFGPTRCRMIYYCEACKNSFEHMKRV